MITCHTLKLRTDQAACLMAMCHCFNMAQRKRSAQPKSDNGTSGQDRVSLAPLNPVEALKGLLATPPAEPEPKRRRRKPEK
jgi:hypothetical protein